MSTRLRQWVPPLLSATAALLLTATSYAQDAAQEGEFSVQRFEPAPGSRNYLSVEGVRQAGSWGWTVGLSFDYSRNAFVVVSCKSESDCTGANATQPNDVAIVRDMFTWDLLASLSPIPLLQIGLRAPFAYVSGDGIDPATGSAQSEGLRAFGVGDPTLEGKVRFFGNPESVVALGAAVDVSFPVGNATADGAYIGNESPVTVGLRGIFDGQAGPVSFGLNLKGVWRQDSTLGSTTVGPEFRYGVGAGYRISPVFRVLAEGYGGTRFSSKNGTSSLEIDGAFQVTPIASGLTVTLGGGAGIIEGVGVPAARGMAGILYSREIGDQDGDGINDRDDSCPTVAEDKDAFEDDDGCPEDDNDNDKLVDSKDKCPNQPETVNGLKDDDGCPDDVPDRDKDGIADAEDKCPDVAGKVRTKEWYGCADQDSDGVADPADKCPDKPEDTDGFEDTDGCPDPDNDGDGIVDEKDECIDQPEVKNGFKDEDGCPDQAPDSDGDGISDDRDKCPKQPENFNGAEDDDGCPDAGPSLVKVGDDDIKILERVEFGTNSDKIQGAKSFLVLGAVASVLRARPDIFLVEVAGHTDNVGVAAQNKTLSQKRAESVAKYLTDKGIEKNRIVAKGYGSEKPIADNNTTGGRQTNRRVEFAILRSAKKPGAPPPAAEPAPAAPAPAAPAPAPAPPPGGIGPGL